MRRRSASWRGQVRRQTPENTPHCPCAAHRTWARPSSKTLSRPKSGLKTPRTTGPTPPRRAGCPPRVHCSCRRRRSHTRHATSPRPLTQPCLPLPPSLNSHLQDKAGSAKERVQDAAHDLKERAGDKAGELHDGAADMAGRAKEGAQVGGQGRDACACDSAPDAPAPCLPSDPRLPPSLRRTWPTRPPTRWRR